MSPYSNSSKPEPLSSWNANAINTQTTSMAKLSKAPLIATLAVKKEKPQEIPICADSDASSATAESTPKTAKSKPSACVFVASLLHTKTDVELCKAVTDHFDQFGNIINVKVLRDYSGRPYAFVQYEKESECKDAIAQSHNTMLHGRAIRCEAAKVNRTVFITSFTPISKSAVEETLLEFGETEVVIASDQHGRIKHTKAGEQCRFWFAKFSYRDDAIRAFASLTDDSQYHVEWAKNIEDQCSRGRFDKYTVFVGQLSRLATHKDLERHFSRHGMVKSVSVVHKTLTSYGFVTFESEAFAASAVAKDNHTMFMDKNINVQYRELSNYPKMILSSDMPVVLAPPPVNSRFKAASRAQHESENARSYSPKRDYCSGVDLAFRARRTSLYTQYRDYKADWADAADTYRTWPRSRFGTGGPEANSEKSPPRYYVVGPGGRAQ